MHLPQARSHSLFNSGFTVIIDKWMNGIKVMGYGRKNWGWESATNGAFPLQ